MNTLDDNNEQIEHRAALDDAALLYQFRSSMLEAATQYTAALRDVVRQYYRARGSLGSELDRIELEIMAMLQDDLATAAEEGMSEHLRSTGYTVLKPDGAELAVISGVHAPAALMQRYLEEGCTVLASDGSPVTKFPERP